MQLWWVNDVSMTNWNLIECALLFFLGGRVTDDKVSCEFQLKKYERWFQFDVNRIVDSWCLCWTSFTTRKSSQKMSEYHWKTSRLFSANSILMNTSWRAPISYELTESGLYRIPGLPTRSKSLEYISSLPVTAHPEIFGLHENADITKNSKETESVIETLPLCANMTQYQLIQFIHFSCFVEFSWRKLCYSRQHASEILKMV